MISPSDREPREARAETRTRRRLRRRLAQLPVLPTLMTSGNLACGVTAIFCAAASDALLLEGAILIFAAMFFDMLDGKLARMTGTEGDFGAELDSLADVVSFGVAPAMLVHRLVLGDNPTKIWGDGEQLIWFIVLLYAVFTAFRLARYNVEHSDEATPHFRGLPSPGAAAFLCSWVLFYAWYAPGNTAHPERGTYLIDWFGDEAWVAFMRLFLAAATVLMAVLMVSRIPFPHIGNTLLRGQIGFRRMILLLLILGAIIAYPFYGLIVGTTAYILIGLVPGIIRIVDRWRRGRDILDDEDDDQEEEAEARAPAGRG